MSSDSSSDDDDMMDEGVLAKTVSTLEKQLSKDPYNFDIYANLVSVYRQQHDFIALRDACERTSAVFPMTAKWWLEWIKSEERIATTSTAHEYVINLYAKAVQDYVNVDLWLQYAQYAQKVFANDHERIRDVFESGVRACGDHLVEGHQLWGTFRVFEGHVLEGLDTTATDAVGDQLKRIGRLYIRQLGVPSEYTEALYTQYQEWLNSVSALTGEAASAPAAYVVKKFETSMAECEKRRAHETKLASFADGGEVLYEGYSSMEEQQAWHAYAIDEIRWSGKKHVNRLFSLMERWCARCYLVPDTWLQYISACGHFGNDDDENTYRRVCERASRNCPQSLPIWTAVLRAHSTDDTPRFMTIATARLMSSEHCALVYLSAADAYRLANAYDDAKSMIAEAVKCVHTVTPPDAKSTDETSWYSLPNVAVEYGGRVHYQVYAYWAQFECRYMKNIDEARRIWEQLITFEPLYLQTWRAYIDMEAYIGEPQRALQLYKRLHTQIPNTWSWACQLISYHWNELARQVGTLDDINHAAWVCAQKDRVIRRVSAVFP